MQYPNFSRKFEFALGKANTQDIHSSTNEKVLPPPCPNIIQGKLTTQKIMFEQTKFVLDQINVKLYM